MSNTVTIETLKATEATSLDDNLFAAIESRIAKDTAEYGADLPGLEVDAVEMELAIAVYQMNLYPMNRECGAYDSAETNAHDTAVEHGFDETFNTSLGQYVYMNSLISSYVCIVDEFGEAGSEDSN